MELREGNIPRRHKSRMMGKVKVRAESSWLAAAVCGATCGHASDSCDLHEEPRCSSKHTRVTLADAESGLLRCSPLGSERVKLRPGVDSGVSHIPLGVT